MGGGGVGGFLVRVCLYYVCECARVAGGCDCKFQRMRFVSVLQYFGSRYRWIRVRNAQIFS